MTRLDKLFYGFFTVISLIGYGLLLFTSYSFAGEVKQQFMTLVLSLILVQLIYAIYFVFIKKGKFKTYLRLLVFSILGVPGLFFFVGAIQYLFNISANIVLLGIGIACVVLIGGYGWYINKEIMNQMNKE